MCTRAKQNKEFSNYFPVVRLVLSHLHGSITCNHDLWKQTSSLGMSLLLPSSPTSICCVWYSLLWNTPLASWDQLSWPCSLPAFYAPQASSWSWWDSLRNRKGLDPVKALLSNNLNTPELSTMLPAQTQIQFSFTMTKINSIPVKSSTQIEETFHLPK